MAGCSSVKQTVPSVPIDTGSVPFKLVKGAIVVPVVIAGVTYDFVLDTGGFLTVSDGVKKREGLAVASTIKVSDISQITKTFDIVNVPALTIGNWTITNSEAIVSDSYASYPNRCFGLDGMIGRNLLKDVLLQFDYSKMTLRITNQASNLVLQEDARRKMKISKRGLPSLNVDINGKSRYIELDSGSRDWFSFQSSESQQQLQDEETEVLTYEGVFSFGVSGKNLNAESRYSTPVDEVAIGNVTYSNSYTDLSKKSAPRFGSGLLEYGMLTIDYLNKAYYYQAYSNNPVSIPKERPSFSIAKIDGQYLIKWVAKNSDAEQKGLKYGDRVLEVEGADVESFGSECELYLSDYPFLDQESVQLRVMTTSGEQKEVVVQQK